MMVEGQTERNEYLLEFEAKSGSAAEQPSTHGCLVRLRSDRLLCGVPAGSFGGFVYLAPDSRFSSSLLAIMQ